MRWQGHPQDCHVGTPVEERKAVSGKAIKCPEVTPYEAATRFVATSDGDTADAPGQPELGRGEGSGGGGCTDTTDAAPNTTGAPHTNMLAGPK